jgi:hypothetical protein
MLRRGVVEVPWERFDEALPAFLTVVMMPFTYLHRQRHLGGEDEHRAPPLCRLSR